MATAISPDVSVESQEQRLCSVPVRSGISENTPYVHFEQPCFDFMLPLKGETWLVHGVWFRLVIKAFEHVNDSGRVRMDHISSNIGPY